MTIYLYVFILMFCFSCNRKIAAEKNLQPETYSTRNYIEVGKIMDSVKIPYVIDVENKDKHIVFIGCVHDVGSDHPQFKIIEKYFNRLSPQVVFNEGGQIQENIRYTSIGNAIKKDGETGALKFYADHAGIKMLNGDLDARTEFSLALKKVPKDDMLLYYIMERIVIPYHYNAYKNENFDSVFDRTIERHFIKNGFPLSLEERKIGHFRMLYKKAVGKDFDINSLDVEAFDYINDNCKFCEVGRVSKIIRDSVLLSKIDHALDRYDRIMVTFGHGHALAVEPALKEIVNKKRH